MQKVIDVNQDNEGLQYLREYLGKGWTVVRADVVEYINGDSIFYIITDESIKS